MTPLNPLNQRYLALDVFRGMTICFMIIVNTPGNHPTTYAPLLHAEWNGFTPTDLVFPSFLFAVGNAMSFAMKKWADVGQTQVLAKIFKRTLLLFLIGYLLSWFPFIKYDLSGHMVLKPFAQTRILGVLQRIGLCYGIAALMIWYLKPKTAFIASVIFLIAYWFILLWFGEPGNQLGLTGNAVSKLDWWLIGPDHMYHGEGVPFEAEGLLSTLPAVVNVIAGYLVGRFIQTAGKTWEMLAKLLIVGCLLTAVGWGWDLSFAINKKLWTSSFVLYTTGLDCIILAVAVYIINFLNKTRWTWFFEVFGKNPLFIYIVAEVAALVLHAYRPKRDTTLYKFIFDHFFSYAGMYFGSLLFAIWFMLMCWLAGWWLDRRKIYIRI